MSDFLVTCSINSGQSPPLFFVIGVALAAASAFLPGLCYIGGRNQKDSFWTNDFMMGSIYVPGIKAIMMLSLGAFYHTFKTFGTRPLTGAEWAAGIAVAVVSILAWQFTGLGRKIKACRRPVFLNPSAPSCPASPCFRLCRQIFLQFDFEGL